MQDGCTRRIERGGAVPLALRALGLASLATHHDRPCARRTTSRAESPRRRDHRSIADVLTALGARPDDDVRRCAGGVEAGTLDAQEGTLATFAAARLDALGVKHVVHVGRDRRGRRFAVNRAVWAGWRRPNEGSSRDAAREVAADSGARCCARTTQRSRNYASAA